MSNEEFKSQLQWALNYAQSVMPKATVSLDFLRHVEELQAKLDAVPVVSIRNCAFNEDAMCSDFDTVEAWLTSQKVQP